jgi:hypothetical protein
MSLQRQRAVLTMRVHAIQVCDDDGGRGANVTPDQVAQWVTQVSPSDLAPIAATGPCW